MKPQKRTQGGRTVYRSQVRCPDTGRRLNITGDTEAEVVARVERLREIRRDIKLGMETPAHRAHMRTLAEGALTVRQVWDRYLESLRPATAKKMRSFWAAHFGPAFGESLRAAGLTGERMAEWEKQVAGKGASASHVAHLSNVLRAAFYRQINQGRLGVLPWRGSWAATLGTKTRLERQHLEPEGIHVFLREAERHDAENARRGLVGDVAARAVVLFLEGLRQGELGGLGWDDFQELPDGRRTVQVRHQVTARWRQEHPTWTRPLDLPKGPARRRDHQLDPPQVCNVTTARVLDQHRARLVSLGWYQPDGPVFPATSGEHAGTWRNDEATIKPALFRAIAAKAGLPVRLKDFVPHCARHTFATLEARAATDLRAYQVRLRDKDLRVALGYYHTAGKMLPGAGIDMSGLDLDGFAPMPEVLDRAPTHGRSFDEAILLGGAELHAASLVGHDIADPETKTDTMRVAWFSWTEAGRPTERPQEIEALARAAYARGYQRARRRGETPEEQKKAGSRGRHAFLGKWAQVSAMCEREASEPRLRKAGA